MYLAQCQTIIITISWLLFFTYSYPFSQLSLSLSLFLHLSLSLFSYYHNISFHIDQFHWKKFCRQKKARINWFLCLLSCYISDNLLRYASFYFVIVIEKLILHTNSIFNLGRNRPDTHEHPLICVIDYHSCNMIEGKEINLYEPFSGLHYISIHIDTDILIYFFIYT